MGAQYRSPPGGGASELHPLGPRGARGGGGGGWRGPGALRGLTARLRGRGGTGGVE